MTVSIVVPAYNCAAYLAETLHSLRAQSEADIEIIVVDDGSTDATLRIAQDQAAHDARVRVFTQRNSGTPAAARNRGLREARGEFVAFVDGDDLYHPEKIACQLQALQAHPELDIVFCDVVQFTTEPYAPGNECYLRDRDFVNVAAGFLQQLTGDVYRCSEDFYRFMSTRFTCLCTPNVLIRRRVLQQESVWFPEGLVIGEDLDLWFRLARRAQIGYVNRALAYYRHHRAGITKNPEHNLRGAIAAHSVNLERGMDMFNAEDVKILRRMLARQHFSLAYLRFLALDRREARGLYRQARHYDPTVFSRAAYLKTFLPKTVVKTVWRRNH